MFMNDMQQRSYLISFEISWFIGFCNQWALLYLCYFSILFWMMVQYVIQDILKHFFCKMLLCCFSVSDTSPYIVCYETKESEILCLPGQ